MNPVGNVNTKGNFSSDITAQLNSARALLRSGDIAGAEGILNSILASNSKNPEVLGLLATAVFLRGDKRLSEKLWKRSLDNPAQPFVFFANLHSFLHALMTEENRESAIKQAARKLPEWPVEQQPNAGERDMLIELADMLAQLEQSESARRLLVNVSAALPADNKLTASLGLMQMFQGEFGAALETLSAVDRAIQPRTDLSLLVRIYQCAQQLKDKMLKESLVKRAVDAYPVFIAPKRSSQVKNILVINRAPGLDKTIESVKNLFFGGNYPAQIAEKLAGEFHFSSIFSSLEESRAAKCAPPSPDLIINNDANGERIIVQDDLATLSGFVDAFGVPVVNHPQKVVSATRDRVVKLTGDVPGVIVPNTLLVMKEQKTEDQLADEIESHFSYPLITRTLTKQEGKGMQKIDDRHSLVDSLPSIPDEFYVTQFIDSRDEAGFCRKIRAAVVGDEVVIVRVDYDTYWNIHGRKSDERVNFYREHPHLLDNEDRICSRPDIELGAPAMEALEAIRQRIPLEIFGIDFDVTGKGEMVFYEANATMNLLLTAPPEVNHPVQVEERLQSAFQRYLHHLAG